MIRNIILTLLWLQNSYASGISLQNLLDSAAQNSSLKQAIIQENLSRKAASHAESLSEPVSLFGSIAQADLGNGKKEDEYSIGISKNIKFYSIQEQERQITQLESQAMLLEGDKTVLNFENGLKDLYHQHCVEKKAYYSIKNAYDEFVELYRKKQKAYEFKEVSKVELMQLQMEKQSLYMQLNDAKIRQNTSKMNLLRVGNIDKGNNKTMLCRDLYPIKKEILTPSDKFTYTKEAYQKYTKSSQKKVQRYANALDSIELSMQYDKELDMDRYSLGFSIPLHFTNEKSEQKRLEAMHQSSALQHRYEYEMRHKSNAFFSLKSELKSKAMTIRSLASNLKKYKDHLLPLIDKSYDLGEHSVVEFLLTKQRYRHLQQEYYQNQKSYYHTLFKFFALIEKKDKQ